MGLTKNIYHNFVKDLLLILRKLLDLSRVDIRTGGCGDIFRFTFLCLFKDHSAYRYQIKRLINKLFNNNTIFLAISHKFEIQVFLYNFQSIFQSIALPEFTGTTIIK